MVEQGRFDAVAGSREEGTDGGFVFLALVFVAVGRDRVLQSGGDVLDIPFGLMQGQEGFGDGVIGGYLVEGAGVVGVSDDGVMVFLAVSEELAPVHLVF